MRRSLPTDVLVFSLPNSSVFANSSDRRRKHGLGTQQVHVSFAHTRLLLLLYLCHMCWIFQQPTVIHGSVISPPPLLSVSISGLKVPCTVNSVWDRWLRSFRAGVRGTVCVTIHGSVTLYSALCTTPSLVSWAKLLSPIDISALQHIPACTKYIDVPATDKKNYIFFNANGQYSARIQNNLLPLSNKQRFILF